MKLTAFMTVYKSKRNIDEKAALLREHITDEYVPYERKLEAAQRIVNSCYYKKEDINGIERRVLHVDSVAKYMLTCMTLIELFTDIERSKVKDKMLDDFNMLNSSNFFDLLVKNIDQRELKEFNMVLQLVCDDVMTNEYENHAFISNQIERFGKLINVALAPVLERLDFGAIQDILKEIK